MILDYLLDTDICIHVLKGRSPELLRKFKANDGRMALSDVTLFELCYGAEKYTDPSARLNVIESLIARLEILPFESHAARHAGQVRAVLEKQGRSIGSYDIMIAAIARSRGLTLATGNVGEFKRVDGLRVERWV